MEESALGASEQEVTGGGETLAARFARDGIERCRRGALVLVAFAGTLLIISAAASRFWEPTAYGELLPIRLAGLVSVGAIFWLLSSQLGTRRPRELTVALLLVMSLTIHELAQSTGGQLSPQYDRMTLPILGVAIMMSWNAAWSLLAASVVVGTYVVGSLTSGGLGTPEFLGNLGRLLVASLVTVGANVVRERMRWRELSHVHALIEARARADAQIRALNEELEQRVLERTAALRISEERFRTMFEAAPIGAITVDAKGRLVQANRAFAALLQRAPGELARQPLETLAAEGDGARALRAHAELRAGRTTPVLMHTRYLRSDGALVSTDEAVVAIRDEAGRFLYALGMVQDVSERERAEEQAREQQEQLAHVLRVTTMGGMVAELAHELNQPLGAIVNFANGTSARLRQSGADPELSNAVALIAGEGMRAAEILRRVREFVRPGGLARAPVDLNELVREAALLVEADARRAGIPLRLRLDPAVPPVSLDRIQVEQVILNLLRNSLEAMRAAPGRAHEIGVRTLHGRDGVEVHVSDSGVGVAPEVATRIFDAFFTTKPGGLGMGLAISRSIVEAYGGRLWARPNAGHGTTFAFSLPVGEAQDGDALAVGEAAQG